MNAYRRHDTVTIPAIRIALVLSILLHALALWLVLPHLRELADARDSGTSRGLAVRLVPRETAIASVTPAQRSAPPAPPAVAAAPPAPEPPPQRARAHAAPAKKPAAPRITAPKPSAPRIAVAKPAPLPAPAPSPVPAPTPPPAVAPEPAPATTPTLKPSPVAPAPGQDLAAYVDARRRARGEAPAADAPSAPTSAESDIARRDRIVAANLGLDRTPVFGEGPKSAGGLFQIVDLNYDDARFYFFGFDKDIQRNARQLIDVRRGDNADIRIAIVRRMIGIIREKIPGDFIWVSQRLGRRVTLSARPEDNAGLEDFILHDVFPDARVP